MTASTIRPVRHLALAAALTCLAAASVPAWAQREGAPSRTTQVQFQRGATEATYKGSLRGLESHSYRFTARKGQLLHVTLDSLSPDMETTLNLIGKNGVAVNSANDPLQTNEQTLPQTGSYEIQVMRTQDGKAAHPYTMTVSITGGNTAAAAEPEAPADAQGARWINYGCQGGKSVSVRYHYGEATASAQVQVDGRHVAMKYSPESNADTTVFEGGGMSWNIENLPPARKLQAKGGMLMRAGTEVVNGQKMPVSEILRKDCNPAR